MPVMKMTFCTSRLKTHTKEKLFHCVADEVEERERERKKGTVIIIIMFFA